MKRRPKRFSLQFKLLLLYCGGFVAFLVYFLLSSQQSEDTQELLQRTLTTDLPVLEAGKQIGRSIANSLELISRDSVSANLQGLEKIENSRLWATRELAQLETSIQIDTRGDHRDFSTFQSLYQRAYQNASDLNSEAMASRFLPDNFHERLDSVREDFKNSAREISIFTDSYEVSLRRAIDRLDRNDRVVHAFGIFMLLGLLPLAFFFIRMLRRVNHALLNTGGSLSVAAEKIYAISSTAQISSHELAANSTLQASSVQDTVTNMEEMKSMLSRTLAHSVEALDASEANFKESCNGKSVAEGMRNTIVQIENSYQDLKSFIGVVHDIRDKTKVINDIVFKTQLLSFNASIEAARAGQHGRGFSVVAEEVGKLAESSGTAAVEIEHLLEKSLRQILMTVERAEKNVNQATSLSNACTGAFERITERAGQTKAMVSFIQQASSEQYTGIQGIGQAMMNLSEAAQATYQLAQSLATLSETLNGESDTLSTAVSDLNKFVKGGKVRHLFQSAGEDFTASEKKSA